MSRNRTALLMVTLVAVTIVLVATCHNPVTPPGWPVLGASGITFAVAALLDEVL